MKEEEGLVIGVSPQAGTATVKVGRHAECSACGACAGSRQLTVEAVNGPGAVLIAGTGAVCFGRDAQGNSFRVGGYGYLIDDGGSG